MMTIKEASQTTIESPTALDNVVTVVLQDPDTKEELMVMFREGQTVDASVDGNGTITLVTMPFNVVRKENQVEVV